MHTPLFNFEENTLPNPFICFSSNPRFALSTNNQLPASQFSSCSNDPTSSILSSPTQTSNVTYPESLHCGDNSDQVNSTAGSASEGEPPRSGGEGEPPSAHADGNCFAFPGERSKRARVSLARHSGRTDCGPECMNRQSFTHCDSRSCPCGDSCTNK